MKVHRFSHSLSAGWSGLPLAADWDSPQTLVLAFCSPRYREEPQAIGELTRLFPRSVIAGCSTSGEISGSEIYDLTMQVVAVKFKRGRIRAVTAPIPNPGDSFDVGKALAQDLLAEDLKGCLILSDGLNTNGSALIQGFNIGLGSLRVPVGGGLAGDGNRFGQTWVIDGGAPADKRITVVGFYGAGVSVAATSRGGWDIFGPERVITKSAGNVVLEIDSKPALDLYKQYLGDRAKDLPSSGLFFPLQIWSDDQPQKKLVRTVLAVDDAAKSLTFAGDVPTGCRAQLMRANFERVIDGASVAAEDLRVQQKRAGGSDSLTIAISCVGRRLTLGARADEELSALQEVLGEKANVLGFYSYGELAPHLAGSACELHNQTMTLTGISEAEEEGVEEAA